MEITERKFEIQYQSLQTQKWYCCQSFNKFEDAIKTMKEEPTYNQAQ